jgi:hypothetical protein
MSEVYGKTEPYNPLDDLHKNLPPRMLQNNEVNVHAAQIYQNEEDFRRIARGHSKNVDQLAEVMTMRSEEAAQWKGKISELLDETRAASLQAHARRSTMAEATAATAGEINEGFKQATIRRARGVRTAAEQVYDQGMRSAEHVVESVKGHGAGKAIAIGAAVAAGAGLLLGSMHSPREGQALVPSHASMNSYRPEEAIGTEDAIPGEPVSGSMANRPPRTIQAARPGVQTAVVAPMHNQANLEVRMRARDRDRAAEVARTTSRLSSGDGDSRTTINYRDVRSGALRTADKIRGLLS